MIKKKINNCIIGAIERFKRIRFEYMNNMNNNNYVTNVNILYYIWLSQFNPFKFCII